MDQRKRPYQAHTSSDCIASDSKRMKPDCSKTRLLQLYGKNQPSNKKLRVAEEITNGKNFVQLSVELGVSEATTEVYAIDCLAAGRKLDHSLIAQHLGVSSDNFQRIKVAIQSNDDNKLRTIRDSLQQEFTYNKIRFVLACLIQELEL